MDLDKKKVIEVFRQNFNSKIIETELGEGIVLSSYDAFIFSTITGAGYLDNPIMPFSPKGLMKVFYNAFNYNYVTGLFDNTNLKNTPYQLSLLKPFLFTTENKTIIPIEFNSELELQDFLFDKISTLENPTQYVILRIEKSKRGNGMEPFMEYIANRYFINEGFICENQIPLTHSLGSPDFGGYGIPKILSKLSEFDIFFRGMNIIELAMLRFRKNESVENSNYSKSLIVGEAKTSTTNMKKQLEKYLSSNLFEMGLEIHPYKQKITNDSIGLLSFDKNLVIRFQPPKNDNIGVDYNYQTAYKEWLENYFKLYLLANLTNDEFQNFYTEYMDEKISTNSDITSFISEINFDKILLKLKSLEII